MMKKFVCLFLVLALAGAASAGTSRWIGTTGNWEVTANWTGASKPALNDNASPVYACRSDTTASSITVTTYNMAGTAIANDLYMNIAAVDSDNILTINGGAKLDTHKNTYMQSAAATGTPTSTVNILLGGIWNSNITYNGGTFNMANVSGARSNDTVNIYGTLNVKKTLGTGTNNASLSMTNVSGGSGTATVNIFSTGYMWVDTYTIGTRGTGRIYIQPGGQMWVKGDARTKVGADVGTKIQVLGGGTPAYGLSGGNTWVGVPEPATIALLGLGGLLFCRKKH